MTLCVTIATNLTDGLLINYTRIGSAFNKLSENIYFYILTLLIMAVVFDFLRAILGGSQKRCTKGGDHVRECSRVECGSSVGRMPDSQSREPGFESPLLPFRRLGIFFHFT